MANSYIGDIGTVITLETGIDLTGASVAQIKIKKPNGTTVAKAATIATTTLTYTTIAGDLDLEGAYTVQAYAVIGAWKGHGAPAHFYVEALSV